MKKPSWLSRIKALGWDLDGTMYPSNRTLITHINRRQLQAVEEKMGWDAARTRREYRRRYERLNSDTKTLQSFGIDGLKFFTSLWDEIDVKRFIHRDERIAQLFEVLSRFRHFMISNSNRTDQVEKKLRLIGLQPQVFELIVSTVDLGAVKPDPKPFLVALEKLELSPEQVLFIGDREKRDVLGANGVGMRTCLVWGSSNEADISLPTVYDVSRLFEK